MHDLRAAYRDYLDRVATITRTGAWGSYADLFEPDAVFHRSGVPVVRGRENIRAMILTETTTLPGSLIERTDIVWHALDHAHARVVQEMRHVARDPGDGSRCEALATSVLHLGCDGLWSRVDVTHSPYAYQLMFRAWARAASRCGREDEARRVMDLLEVAHPVV